MPHQSTPTTYQSPKTTNWPMIILGILGVIIVVGIFFAIAVNKDVIKSDLSRRNISERGSSVLDPYLKNYDEVAVDCFDSEKGTFVPCEEIGNDDEESAVEGGNVFGEESGASVRVSACGREFGGKTVCYDNLYKYETNANLQCASEGQTGMNPPGTCCPGLERVDGIRVAYGNVATPGTLCLTSCANGTYRQINGDCGPNPVANCLKENESATPDLWSDPRYCCPGLGHSVLVPDINMCVKIADTGVGYTANGSCSGSICSNYPNSSSSGVVDNTPPVVTGRAPAEGQWNGSYGFSDIITDGPGTAIHIYTDEPAICRMAEGTKSFNEMQLVYYPTGYTTDSFFYMPGRVGQTIQYTVLCEDSSGNRMATPLSFSLRHYWLSPVCLGENVWGGRFSLSDFRNPPAEVKENLLLAIPSDDWVITRNDIDYAVPYGYASLGVNTLQQSRYNASVSAVMFLSPLDIISLQYRGNRSNENWYVNGAPVQRAPYRYQLQNPIAPGGTGPLTTVGVSTQTFLTGDPASHSGGVNMMIEEAGWPSMLGSDKLSTIPAYIPKVKILSPLANSKVPGATTMVSVNVGPADAIYSVELLEVTYYSGSGGHSSRSLGKLTHPSLGTTTYEWSWTPSSGQYPSSPSPAVVLEARALSRYGSYNTDCVTLQR